MSWQNSGVFAPPQGQTPPGATGVPQMPQGQQSQPAQQYQGGYSPDHLPPPPGQGQQQGQQGGYAPPPTPYGVQPGVPGTQIAQPWNTQAPQQQVGLPQQAQPWQGQQPQGQPQQQGWPQQQQPQGFPQQARGGAPQQQSRAVQLDDNTILDGPSVPPELRGRSWGDARRLYGALATDWLQRNGRPQPPAQQTLQSMQPQQGFQQPQGAQPNGQQDPRQFWQNPDERIAQVVSQVIDQRLGPVVQHTQGQAILQARQIAATGIQDFDYLEPDIMQIVAGANPQDLQNPQVWIAAARMARGQRMETGQYQFQPRQQQPQVPGQNGNGNGYGQQSQYAPPPVNSFFSEAPSAPNVPSTYGGFDSGRQPTQDDYFYAQKWQMPIQDFMAWKYGAGQPGVGGSF